jgi:hypothetical protein
MALQSKRFILSIVALLMWFILGMYGIHRGIDLNNLAAFVVSSAPVVFAYIWGETKRKSENI